MFKVFKNVLSSFLRVYLEKGKMTPQQYLVAFGLLEDYKIKVTDPRFIAATKIFQELRNLSVDGVFGPNTNNAAQISLEAGFHAGGQPVDNLLDGLPPFSEEVCRMALQELLSDSGEKGGNNKGADVAKYHRMEQDKSDRLSYSWCASFCSWCMDQAATKLSLKLKTPYTGGAKKLFRSFIFSYDNPRSGSLVCWDRGTKAWQGHVGFCLEVYGYKEDVFLTIEGNVGSYPSEVEFFVRKTDDIKLIGFADLEDALA